MTTKQKLTIPGNIDVGPVIRLHRDVEPISHQNGTVATGSKVRNQRTIDVMRERGTISDREWQAAENFYRDWRITQGEVRAINYEDEYGRGLCTHDEEAYAEAIERLRGALRCLPLGATLTVTTKVCIDNLPLKQCGMSYYCARKIAKAGIEILFEYYDDYYAGHFKVKQYNHDMG